MELSEIYSGFGQSRACKISFEVFPPKNGDISALFEELRFLKKYNPALVSLTFGASGGAGRFDINDLKSIRDLDLNLMPHFTCVSFGKADILSNIRQIENLGIENILALRGDIPQGLDKSELEFHYASELVEFINEKTTLSVGVAGYPEGHIESVNLDVDIEYLKNKIDKGGSAIFTQLFFDNSKFYSYVEKVIQKGISVPIIPGIMPIRSLKQVEKMISMAKVTFPKKLMNDLEKYPNDTKKIGVEFAISQCQNLMNQNVAGLHFFTLNHSDMVSEILDNIL